ncbi:hypothetical protein VCSRO38_2505 [Vibrio cholerae]|nr:hypothetical protein VCSRO38_2505 [Vibrio cholerae]
MLALFSVKREQDEFTYICISVQIKSLFSHIWVNNLLRGSGLSVSLFQK